MPGEVTVARRWRVAGSKSRRPSAEQHPPGWLCGEGGVQTPHCRGLRQQSGRRKSLFMLTSARLTFSHTSRAAETLASRGARQSSCWKRPFFVIGSQSRRGGTMAVGTFGAAPARLSTMKPSASVDEKRNLVAGDRLILANVPDHVTILPNASPQGLQGTFLGSSFETANSHHVFRLGLLRNTRFLSCFRFKLWWMTQRVGTCGHELPVETQFLLLECPPTSAASSADRQPRYAVLLPLLDGSFRASLQGSASDHVEVVLESGDPAVTTSGCHKAVFVHTGDNPFRVISEAVRAVEEHTGSFVRRERKQMPGLLDCFGWCTWDAFYTGVHAEGVKEGLSSLAAGGTPARFLIIDDGWQQVAGDSHADLQSLAAKVSQGTQYAKRLTHVHANHKFKAEAQAAPMQPPTAQAEAPAAPAEGQPGTDRGQQAEGPSAAGSPPCASPTSSASSDAAAAEADDDCLPASWSPTRLARADEQLGPAAPAIHGLGSLVQHVKAEQRLKFVYVWHALMGYWGGVRPGAASMAEFEADLVFPVPSPSVLHNQPDMAEDSLTLNGLGVVHPSKILAFYDAMHSYLAACGVDGVKVDVQNILETLGAGYGGRVHLAREYHRALEASVAKNFPDNGVISCMSHNTDGLYSAKQTAIMRASDDFWPQDPASHTVHVVSVAYNTLFLGEFMQPDWDMFHSRHPAAEFHGAARAVGGCAVYVSDKPAEHDFAVLRKLVLPDGSVLRASLPGRPTRDCLFVDPARDSASVLKIWNLNPCNGVVGAFNCQVGGRQRHRSVRSSQPSRGRRQSSLQGAGWCREGRKYAIHNDDLTVIHTTVGADDVDALADVAPPEWQGDVAVLCHNAGKLLRLQQASTVPVALQRLQFEVFTVAPVLNLPSAAIAPIGLIHMFNSGGAVRAVRLLRTGDAVGAGDKVGVLDGYEGAEIQIRGEGEFVVYVSRAPFSCTLEGNPTPFSYEAEEGRLTVTCDFEPQVRSMVVLFASDD